VSDTTTRQVGRRRTLLNPKLVCGLRGSSQVNGVKLYGDSKGLRSERAEEQRRDEDDKSRWFAEQVNGLTLERVREDLTPRVLRSWRDLFTSPDMVRSVDQ
jgi:hypothetical protein